MNIELVLEEADRFTNKMVGTGAAHQQIQQAETILGVALPASYKAFLRRFGWGRFAGERFYGIGDDVPPYQDLVKVTMAERVESVPGLPNHFIPVLNDGSGSHYCIDSSRSVSGESPIVYWNHELGPDQEIEIIAPSFTEWFRSVLIRLQGDM